MSIKIRIQERLNRSRRYVFIRADFGDIAGYDHLSKGLLGKIHSSLLLHIDQSPSQVLNALSGQLHLELPPTIIISGSPACRNFSQELGSKGADYHILPL